MNKTSHGIHKAIVKESVSGAPYILFELLSGDEIPAFRRSNVGLSFKDGTSYEEVCSIAHTINEKLSGLILTEI